MGGFERCGFGDQRVDVVTVGGQVEVVDCYGTTLGQEREGDGAADTRGAACYDGCFAG